MSPRTLEGKTYWLVGASEGLGRELARELHRMGVHLILSARNEERLQELASELEGAKVLPMDVTDTESVRAAMAEAGHADGMIYSVGLYEPMRAQEWDPEMVERVADANFMGALRVLGRLMPGWVERRSGHIVLIGSLAAFKGLPGSIGYGASKAALRHLAEDMYLDLQGTGIDVQVANPGFIRTRLAEKNSFTMTQLMEPAEAARRVMTLIRNPEPRQISFPRPFSLVFTVLGRWLPFRLYAKLVS
ncbi:NADP-dependent 3-hydroxy acid dehydrogenase YdfG [Pseudooceanicola antarcticus]|uniref:NADP-dependent 3-hydroxy acid dehydrogenase YdfG n=1 Tax=Pseudooceanicola antarcticus TaxID=1247613 RepID=A0A285HM10_9RHOB|nr:SDR family NAD(P)-dependent oxidoreductase [Pseudooceanicola antarcticus]PJE27819.1 short-chain dehydrogenase [Pseudooceanicola antarcticus]SNY36755.1 NADP-dependent 3-hydroxy acid dehydrogenase YdfG [Pseudooceanicola antarcticus]